LVFESWYCSIASKVKRALMDSKTAKIEVLLLFRNATVNAIISTYRQIEIDRDVDI